MIQRTNSVLISVIFLQICLTVFAQEPAIIQEILPDVKPRTETGYLNCTVINTDSQSVVVWQKDKVPGQEFGQVISRNLNIIVSGSTDQGKQEDGGLPKYGITLTQNGKQFTYTLIVRYLMEVDSGNYTCSINIQGVDPNKFPRKKGNILVTVPPVIKTTVDTVYERLMGDNVTLTCEASGDPKPNITWKREDGSRMSNGAFNFKQAVLQLTNIQKSDSGNYICIADNSVRPPADMKVEVRVFYSPTCSAVQNTVGQAQNRRFSARLECIVKGYPEPQMHWEILKDYAWKQISDEDDYVVNRLSGSQNLLNGFWYTLKIVNVRADHYTKYRCVATNRFGSNFTQFELFETAECQGYDCPTIGASTNIVACAILTLLSMVISLGFLVLREE